MQPRGGPSGARGRGTLADAVPANRAPGAKIVVGLAAENRQVAIMNRLALFRATFLTAFLLTGCSGSLPASDMRQEPSPPGSVSAKSAFDMNVDGHWVHVMRPRGYPIPHREHWVGNLIYHNGTVQTTPSIYVVYWQFTTDPDNVATDLTGFLTVVGGSTWLNTVTQYYQWPRSRRKIYVHNSVAQLKGVWYDNTNPIPLHPTDTQIEREAFNLAQHFGSIKKSAVYFVATPTGHGGKGFPNQYCAYHSNAYYYYNIAYVNLPYQPDAGYYCGANYIYDPQGIDEGVTTTAGHELAETQTDPLGQGWFDYNYQHEIGDECAWTNWQYTSFGSVSYTTQPLWSNSAGGCVQ